MRLFLLGTACALVHNRTSDPPHENVTHALTKTHGWQLAEVDRHSHRSRRQSLAPEQTQEVAREASAPEDFVSLILGFMAFSLAMSVHWFNEERSAKIEVLLTKGLEDCRSVDANHINSENRGRLVHVQGTATGKTPIADAQFQDAVVRDCLKLQSTLEVLQWVPGKELPGQPRHLLEWSTSYQDSSRFRQPSPQNPRLPAGLVLGTTTSCSRVTLGAFSLSQEMLVHFRSYESASPLLPKIVHACGIPFFAREDGFFYARPGSAEAEAIFRQKQVGDLRVRFLCTKNCQATVVAVQCHKEFQDFDVETFLPYRIVPRALCDGERQERLKIVEAGERSLRDFREASCCTGGVATCCCCPCNTVACFTSHEIMTEEIFFVSDSLEAKEKPFHRAVCRSPWRLWNLRVLGWALTYLSLRLMLLPLLSESAFAGLSGWGRSASAVLLLSITLEVWAATVAAAYSFYRPSMGIKYFAGISIVSGTPFLLSQLLQIH